MKKAILFTISFVLLSVRAISAEAPRQAQTQQAQEISQLNDLEQQIRGDFRLFLEEIYVERDRSKKESQNITKETYEVLKDVRTLVDESRKEIKAMTYSESRNLLIATIFLWISITIFIIMNLVFANNLKKELYFLRNGLLRSEIKDSISNLLDQLNTLNEKLDSINRG